MRTPASKTSGPVARKARGSSKPRLAEMLRRTLAWTPTADLFFPWKAELSRVGALAIRLNDFPDEPMYTLFVGKQEIGSFDDWPSTWHRSELHLTPAARSTAREASLRN